MSVSLPPIASPAQRSGMMDVVPPSAAERAALFRKFDPSGNGLLSLGEATAAVHQEFPFFSDQKAIKQAFRAADTSGDGAIGKKEFALFLEYLSFFSKMSQEFHQIDANGDGRLDEEEFAGAAHMLGDPLEAEEVHREFMKMDDNAGGYVLFDEFCVWAARRNAVERASTATRTPSRLVFSRADGCCASPSWGVSRGLEPPPGRCGVALCFVSTPALTPTCGARSGAGAGGHGRGAALHLPLRRDHGRRAGGAAAEALAGDGGRDGAGTDAGVCRGVGPLGQAERGDAAQGEDGDRDAVPAAQAPHGAPARLLRCGRPSADPLSGAAAGEARWCAASPALADFVECDRGCWAWQRRR